MRVYKVESGKNLGAKLVPLRIALLTEAGGRLITTGGTSLLSDMILGLIK